jgi:hypothetical protein
MMLNFEQLKILWAILTITKPEEFLNKGSFIRGLYDCLIVNQAFYRPSYLSYRKLWTNERPQQIDKMLFIYGSNQIEAISSRYRKVYEEINKDEFDLSALNELYGAVIKTQLELRGKSKFARQLQELTNKEVFRKGSAIQLPEYKEVESISQAYMKDIKGVKKRVEDSYPAPEIDKLKEREEIETLNKLVKRYPKTKNLIKEYKIKKQVEKLEKEKEELKKKLKDTEIKVKLPKALRRQYELDGQKVPVKEQAEKLGVTVGAIYQSRRRRKKILNSIAEQ